MKKSSISSQTELPLDPIDLQILAIIQDNAGLSNVELANLVHLSPSQCARRLARLRQEGYIERVVAILNPEKFGLAIMVHSAVSLHTHELKTNEAFKRFALESPEVLECYAQTGDADFMLKIIVPSLTKLNELFERMFKATGGVASLRSGVVMNTIKQVTALPLQSNSKKFPNS